MPPPLLPGTPHAAIAALLESLRQGRAGFMARLGLSFAGAAAGVGVLMLILGVVDFLTHRVRDEHVAIGVVVLLLGWIGLLYPIWASYSRKQHVVKTILVCLGVVVATAGGAVAFGVTMRDPEFFIAATIFLGVASLAAIITAAAHQAARGRALTTAGAISVLCPACGYSMSGLESSACPECGAKYTLDALIRAQDYDSLRSVPAPRDLPTPAQSLLPRPEPQNPVTQRALGP